MTLATVRPEWVDHYGHMNLAYYVVVFDLATDRLWPTIRLGAQFRARGLGTFAAETWIGYRREVVLDDPLDCDSRVLAYDSKRLIIGHTMRQLRDDTLAAETEVKLVCVDLATRRAANWPEDVLAAFAAARAEGAAARYLSLARR